MCRFRLAIDLFFTLAFLCCCVAFVFNWLFGVLDLLRRGSRPRVFLRDLVRVRPADVVAVFREPLGRRTLIISLVGAICWIVLFIVSGICGPA